MDAATGTAATGIMQRLRAVWGSRVCSGLGLVEIESDDEMTRVVTDKPSRSRVLRIAAEMAERRRP